MAENKVTTYEAGGKWYILLTPDLGKQVPKGEEPEAWAQKVETAIGALMGAGIDRDKAIKILADGSDVEVINGLASNPYDINLIDDARTKAGMRKLVNLRTDFVNDEEFLRESGITDMTLAGSVSGRDISPEANPESPTAPYVPGGVTPEVTAPDVTISPVGEAEPGPGTPTGEEIPQAAPIDWRDLTEAEIDEFMAAAEEELGPYYQEKMAVPTAETRIALERITADISEARERSARNLSQALDESRAVMAARGLAFSGIRQKGERQIQTRAQEQLMDLLKPLERGKSDTLRALEQQLGSEAMRGLYPGYSVPQEYLALPGGGLTGAIPYEQTFETERYGLEKIAGEREARTSDWLRQALGEYYI